MTTLVVSTAMTLETWKLFTISLSSVTVRKMAKNSGLLETHGASTGVRMVSSVSAVVQTTSILRVIALGPLLRILGLSQPGT